MDASLASFQSYRGGVYYDARCSSTQLNHAVRFANDGVFKNVLNNGQLIVIGPYRWLRYFQWPGLLDR